MLLSDLEDHKNVGDSLLERVIAVPWDSKRFNLCGEIGCKVLKWRRRREKNIFKDVHFENGFHNIKCCICDVLRGEKVPEQ